MRSYWVWFLLLAVAWFFAIHHLTANPLEMPLRIVGSAGFFALFFLSPLLRNKWGVHTLLLCAVAVLAIVTLWPESGSEPNPYTLLVFSILAGKAVYRLPALHAIGVGLILLMGAIVPGFGEYPIFPPVFIGLYAVLIGVAFAVFHNIWKNEEEASARNEALLSEYRKMKRRLASEEKLARQEERAQIGREIHDRVGHKLTALLMQLEVFRMQADGQSEPEMKSETNGKTVDRLKELKKLAKESLEETRSAVKTLRQDDAGGLSAIISLIRKLEAESFMRVQFSVKHGALSAPLRNEQSVAVYRAVQEALTNIMRHSRARKAEIMFEAPGGGIFRFEVSNPTDERVFFREGFGLASMRERMEQAGGQLEVISYDNRFVVRGTLSILDKERVKG